MNLERKARLEILSRLEFEGGRILEVSVGSGANLEYLFESSGVDEVYGLDLSPAQLSNASEQIDKRGWPVDLFLGIAETLPFRDNSFDNVFHIGGINFFSGKRKAIEEMIRVAKPGSRIVIADESEHVARMAVRILRLSRHVPGGSVDISVPVHLVPETMEEVQTYGIWKRHGHHHGYVLEFRKPSDMS
jgi:ubiquinone/menaquinone biosynthesis C-methylase UbiE